MMNTVRDLIERLVSFRYGYNMTCDHCGGVTPLTADTYYRESHHARMKCAYCPSDIHYGPNVMTLRDADDPALNDDAALKVSWYHTSTVPGWPAAAVGLRQSRKMSSGTISTMTYLMASASTMNVRLCIWGPTKPRSNRCCARCATRVWAAGSSGFTG